MGSIQQISLGAVCVASAFIFGSYINNHPSIGSKQVANEADNRLSADDLGLNEKRAESMPNLKHRVFSRIELGELPGNASSIVPDGPKLPSPGDLDPRLDLAVPIDSIDNDRELAGAGVVSNFPERQRLSNADLTAPDFSSIAASMDDQFEKPLIAEMPTAKTPIQSNIKNIANSFRGKRELDETLQAPQFKDSAFDGLSKTDITSNSQPTPEKVDQVKASPGIESPFNTVAPSLSMKKPAVDNKTFQQIEAANVDRPTNNLSDTVADEMNSVLDASGQTASAPVATNRVTSRGRAMGDLLSQIAKSDGKTDDGETPFVDRQPVKLHQMQTLPRTQPVIAPADNLAQENLPGIDQQPIRRAAKPPFALTNEAKVKLVRLRTEALKKIPLETTKFAEHIVMPGETLQSISTRYLSKPDFYLDIYLANRDRLSNPVEIPQGIVLKVPLYK